MGVQQCRLRDSAPFGVWYCQAHFRNRTPSVWGATGVIIFVYSLRQSYTDVCQAAVQIPITCAGKCGLRYSAHFGVWHCHVRFWNRTLALRGATEPHNLCAQSVVPVRRCTSGSCTDPYRGCTKMPLASE